MSLGQDLGKFVLDMTGVSAVMTSDLYQNYLRGYLDHIVGGKELNKAIDDLYLANESDTISDPNILISNNDDKLSSALQEIESLKAQLNTPSTEAWIQDKYEGDLSAKTKIEQSIAQMQAALNQAQTRNEQAQRRLDESVSGLNAQSTGGQRKAMKDAVKTARGDVATTNQNIQALTEGIAKAQANMNNIMHVEQSTPGDINDLIAMQVSKDSGAPIIKTTTDPGKLVDISKPTSQKDVTLDEE